MCDSRASADAPPGAGAAGIPVPGFFAASISREISAPAGMSRVGDDALLEHALHLRERREVVLVDRVREHRLELADPVDELLELVQARARSAASGPYSVAREREVLLDDGRAERDRCEAPRTARACGRRTRPACRSARAAPRSTFSPTRSGGVGYCDVHWRTVTSSPAAATAASSSSHELIPDVSSTRLSGRRNRAHELEVRHLARADLVAVRRRAARAARPPRARRPSRGTRSPARSHAAFSVAHCSSVNAVRSKYSQRDSCSKYGGDGRVARRLRARRRGAGT